METVGSLPCSQESVTGPYPEPDKSTPHSHSCVQLFSISFNLRGAELRLLMTQLYAFRSVILLNPRIFSSRQE